MKVLIADGSTLVGERLAGLLSEVDAIEWVTQATDAGATLNGIARWRPDVVLLDMRMPGGDGIRLLAEIKANPSSPAVLMLSAFPNPQCRKRCLELGAELFLDKTMEFDRVAEAVGRFGTPNRFSRGQDSSDAPQGRLQIPMTSRPQTR